MLTKNIRDMTITLCTLLKQGYICLLTNKLEDCFSIVTPSSDSDANVRCGNFYLSASICRYWETYLSVRVWARLSRYLLDFIMHTNALVDKKKWGTLLYILFTFPLIKTKNSKTEENKHNVFKEKNKKSFFLTVQSHSYWWNRLLM